LENVAGLIIAWIVCSCCIWAVVLLMITKW
jgi:hypothetical protein